MLEYSRDALAVPLEALGRILSDVREGRFSPDALRSCRRGAGERIVDTLGYDIALIEHFEPSGAGRVAADGAGAGANLCRTVSAGSGRSSQGSRCSRSQSSSETSSAAADAASEQASEQQDSTSGSVVAAAAPAIDDAKDTDDDDFVDQVPYDDTLDGKQVFKHPRWGTFHLARGASGQDATVACGKRMAGLLTATAAEASAAPADSLCLRCFRTART